MNRSEFFQSHLVFLYEPLLAVW